MFGQVTVSFAGGGGDVAYDTALDLPFGASSSLTESFGRVTLTFTRASNQTYFDSAGTLQTAGTNVAAFDYDPSTLAARGLSLWESRTNVCLWNRDLTNAAWVKVSVTAALDQIGIDGAANSASSITATAGNGTCLQAITLASSARYQTAYVKRITGSGTINMTTDNGATWTAITVTGAWTRVEIPTQTLANPTVGFQIVTSGDAIAVDYVQNENGIFGTPVILVTTVAATRAATLCSTTDLSWFNETEGTFVWEAICGPDLLGARAFTVNSTSGTEYITGILSNSGGAGGGMQIVDGGVTQATVPSSVAVSEGMRLRSAAAYKDNDFAGSLNGAAVVTDTSGSVPAGLNVLYVGSQTASGTHANGWIFSLQYFRQRLPAAGLQAKAA